MKLESIGIDRTIVALAVGELPHAAFEYRCQAIDDPMVENGGVPPPGPPFITLWECCDGVTGFWIRDDRIEFLDFSIESPESYVIIARSTQGLLAWLFFFLVEDEDWNDADAATARLRDAAQAVGFFHLDEVLRIQHEQGKTADAREKYLAFARSID